MFLEILTVSKLVPTDIFSLTVFFSFRPHALSNDLLWATTCVRVTHSMWRMTHSLTQIDQWFSTTRVDYFLLIFFRKISLFYGEILEIAGCRMKILLNLRNLKFWSLRNELNNQKQKINQWHLKFADNDFEFLTLAQSAANHFREQGLRWSWVLLFWLRLL